MCKKYTHESVSECNVLAVVTSRKKIKDMLSQNFAGDIEFHKPNSVNESERVSFKTTRDITMQFVEEEYTSATDMNFIYKAVTLLRKRILKCEKWNFDGTFELDSGNIPNELLNVFRWLLVGPETTIGQDLKRIDAIRIVSALAQNAISQTYTKHQISNKKSVRFSSHRPRMMPQQVATGIIMIQKYRDKHVIKVLHKQGLCVDYQRLLKLENRFVNSVLEQMIVNGGHFIPDNFVKGRFVFFAADNVDFNEDTPDGKRTLHGTAMVLYQRSDHSDR